MNPEDVVQAHKGIIYLVVRAQSERLLQIGIDPEVAAQEAISHACEVVLTKKYDSTRGKPATFLKKITTNFISKMIRARMRQFAREKEYAMGRRSTTPLETLMAKHAIEEERARIQHIKNYIRKLPPSQRDFIRRVLFGGEKKDSVPTHVISTKAAKKLRATLIGRIARSLTRRRRMGKG